MDEIQTAHELQAYYDQQTGLCPLCRRMAVVLAGKLQAHDNPLSRQPCPGAGHPPAGEVLTRRQRAHTRRFIS